MSEAVSASRETAALSVKNFEKKYKDGTVAVNKISFDVAKGAFFGFLGQNGAGKTTTISCITGISYPTGGTIEVFGRNVVDEYKEARRMVGLSPQEFNTDIFAPTWKILDYMGGYYGMTSNERKERIEILLKQFGLEKHRDSMFQKLSGGYKRRVLLARALIHDPDLLILDEPTAGVDVQLRHELWKYLEDLNADGKTIILTSHYIEEVERLCNDIAIIADGEIVAHGTKEDFVKDGNTLEEAFLKITKDNDNES